MPRRPASVQPRNTRSTPTAPAESWTTRIWREFRAGNLTRAWRDALLTLHTYRGTGGLCIPSHATLAERAKVGVRTVARALAAARDLGLVNWTERRIRRGWRWLRTSNAYRLTRPAGDVQPAARPAFPRHATTCQRGGGEESQTKKGLLNEMLSAAAVLPDLLAMRRASIESGMVRKGSWPSIIRSAKY